MSEEDFKRQAHYIRQVESRLREANERLEEERQRNYEVRHASSSKQMHEPRTHWKDNFIKVFVDMLKRLATR